LAISIVTPAHGGSCGCHQCTGVKTGTDAGELHASRHGHGSGAGCGGAIALRVEETGKGEDVSLGLFE